MADKHPKSLRNAKVNVGVEPKDRSVDSDTAKKIEKSLRKEVKKALRDNEDKPSDEQVGKAMGKATERQEELAEEGKDVDIGVAIVGERGEGGPKEVHIKGTGDDMADEIEEGDSDDDEDESLN